MNYRDFCNQKLKIKLPPGIPIDSLQFNKMLFPYQLLIVKIALAKGRFLIGAECGLGKTLMQLEWAKHISDFTDKPVLIVAPLGVAKQTANEEASKFGYKVNIVRMPSEIIPGINITNYEIIDHFKNIELGGVVLDESSILKNFTGTTRILLKELFKNTPYRLCCSATPAPNEFLELLNQADFLGIKDSNKALANFFINDFKTGQWRLKGHATDAFWQWVCSWAVMMNSPSDVGFSDEDYKLPKLEIINDVVNVDLTNIDDPSLGLFRDIELSATSYNKEKRLTAHDRAIKVAEIVSASQDQFIIWCCTNFEADELKEAIPYATEVRGSDSPDFKEKATADFKSGVIRVLISKASIFGYGMNFQNCHRAIFMGMSYSYEDYYQALKRIHRYGQKNDVKIDIVIGTTEKNILDTVMQKAERQSFIKNQMKRSIKDIQIESLQLKDDTFKLLATVIDKPLWLGGINDNNR